MLIKGIKIKNFRQYKNVDLEFSTDPNKNLTVILGENGYGKTTLVRAFIWCFYRDGKLFKNPILLNDDVAKDMKSESEETVSVTIDLEHADVNYRITTTEKYRKNSFGNVVVSSKASTSVIRDTVPLYEGAVDSEINKILKKDLKDYFFYDGENNKIDSMSKKQSLKDAISQMMGIKRLETLKSYFQATGTSGVVGVLNNEFKGSTIDLQPIRDDLDEANEEKEIALSQISMNKEKIEELIVKRDEKQAIIDANKDVQEDQQQLKFLLGKIKSNQEKVDPMFSMMINQFNGKNNAFLKSLYSRCFEKNELEKLTSLSSFGTEKSLSHISEEAIDQLIERGYCICGTVIKDKNDAYQHLIEAKSHMEPHDFGKYLSDFIESEKHNSDAAAKMMNSSKDNVNSFLDHIDAIDVDKDNAEEIKRKIAGRQDVGQWQIDVNTLNDQISNLEGQNTYIIENRIPVLDKKILALQTKLNSAVEKTKDNKLISLCLDYAAQIYSQTEKKIKKAQDDTRSALEKDVNEIFSTMYHGERSISIDKEFNIITKAGDSVLDNSTGTDTVKNFAFVAGLLKSIKNNVLLEEFAEDEDRDECYPLVMDAPFSDTDAEHIRNICKTLPMYCDQIFIIVIKKDFEVAEDDIKDRIGKLYQIQKHSETHVTIKESRNV